VEELSALPLEIDASVADRLVAAQIGYIARNEGQLAARAERGRVVDCHGDLRPEHVSLGPECEIIDCIEFSDTLRLLDSAEELSFLALECARLGQPAIGERLISEYRAQSGDAVTDDQLDFYASRQALNRAMLSARHLETAFFADAADRWIERTHWYLEQGHQRIQKALNR